MNLIIPIMLMIPLNIWSETIKDPIVLPANPFSASVDAGMIRDQFSGALKGPDINKIGKILFHRTYSQRIEIRDFYDTKLCAIHTWCTTYRRGRSCYPRWDPGCPLARTVAGVTDDNLDNLYRIMFTAFDDYLASILYQVIIDKWKEVGAIEEIVCANDKETKDRINQNYQTFFKDTVENQLGTFRSDDKEYQHVMIQYCWKGLCQEKKIKPEDAEKEAKALRDINPEDKKEEFKKKLNELLDKNCEPDLKMIFEKYRKDKDGIDDAVNKAFDVDRVKRAYNRLVRYIENTCKFYADELHAAVDGCGTDIDKINRIIVTRGERDLKCILDKYKETHDETFTNRLKKDTTDKEYLTSIRYLCGKP